MSTFGVITALPKEYKAVEAMLDSPRRYEARGTGTGRRFLIGEIPSYDGGKHLVILMLADMGNNAATWYAARLLEHFPSVESIIMVGIAGGIPNPTKPDNHVRLGDVVVSNQGGVIQYDFVEEEYDANHGGWIITPRHPPRPPSSVMLQAARLLSAEEIAGQKTWVKMTSRAKHLPGTARPKADSDVLVDSDDPHKIVLHPDDAKRVGGQSRVFLGPIASANKLLKNPKLRDLLRDRYGIRAVEMEASGIAEATWNQEVGYIVIRGICDYCDSRKNDDWQGYATVIAAAYMRALLHSIPSATATDMPAPIVSDPRKTASPKINFMNWEDPGEDTWASLLRKVAIPIILALLALVIVYLLSR